MSRLRFGRQNGEFATAVARPSFSDQCSAQFSTANCSLNEFPFTHPFYCRAKRGWL
jgi:hypothetical protein